MRKHGLQVKEFSLKEKLDLLIKEQVLLNLQQFQLFKKLSLFQSQLHRFSHFQGSNAILTLFSLKMFIPF